MGFSIIFPRGMIEKRYWMHWTESIGSFEDYYIYGTPDEIIGQIEKSANVGMKHLVLSNMTYFFDVSKLSSSFNCMKKVLEYFSSAPK